MNIYEKIKFCLEHLRDVPDDYKESTKLLNKWMTTPDKEGIMPEIFATISNRTGGKTYYIAYLLMDLYKRFGTQFALYTRSGTQLGNVVSGIFTAVMEEFPGYTIEEKIAVQNVYSEIYIKWTEKEDDKDVQRCELAGFVLVLNASTKIKNYSSAFYDVEIMFMDEFQASQYLPKEVDKWIDIHMSVARGHGQSSRCVPVIMASNSLSIINPYFKNWGLESKIQEDTKLYRGVGLSLLRFVNDSVAGKQRESRFNKACESSEIFKSNIDNAWLNDSRSCVCKPNGTWGRGSYICTFIHGKNKYGMYSYTNGIYYIGRNIDIQCPNIFAMSVEGAENIETAKRCLPLMVFRDQFMKGNGRFSDISLKASILEWI